MFKKIKVFNPLFLSYSVEDRKAKKCYIKIFILLLLYADDTLMCPKKLQDFIILYLNIF